MSSIDWREESMYYPSAEPCVICGSKYMTGAEPRFNYVVCHAHSKLSPVTVGKLRRDLPPLEEYPLNGVCVR